MSKSPIESIKYLWNGFWTSDTKFFSLCRFVAVGGINTVHYYVWYRVLLAMMGNTDAVATIAHVAAFVISMVGSFFLSCYFTFHVRPTWKRFLKFPLSQALNFTVSTVMTHVFINYIHVSKNIASLISMFLVIPLTFVVTKLLIKPENRQSDSKTV